MSATSPRIANFIIGGTDKAGTTSIFTYFSQHPGVCAASVKETDFFRQQFSGDLERDRAAYAEYFGRCGAGSRIVMEASPGYLAEAKEIAPRMAALVPDVKLLFILREPVDRLYSSFNFHVGRLTLPQGIRFHDYVEKCIAYDSAAASAASLGINEWCLKALGSGRYVDCLAPFFAAFPRENVKVMFFEQLERDTPGFMREVSAFLGIDTAFWDTYEFAKENVTFSVSNTALHKLAIELNNRSERFLRPRPRLKRALVRFYQWINRARRGYDPMPADVRGKLSDYYSPWNRELRDLLGRELPDSWRKRS